MPVSAHERNDAVSLVDTGDFASGVPGNLRVDGDMFAAGNVARAPGEWNFAEKSTLIDAGVESELRLLRERQRRQRPAHEPREFDVALSIVVEELALFGGGLVPANEIRG